MENDERRCLIIDRHPMIRMGVRRLLCDRYEVEEAADARHGLELMTSLGDFDVAIVEFGGRAPGSRLSGAKAIRALRKAKPGLGIVAHGVRLERYAAAEAMAAGATAYVANSSPPESLEKAVAAAVQAEEFVDPAMRKRSNGRRDLTRRQRETLQQYADGRSTAEVAQRLGVTTETVRTHTKAALARLEARDRTHAVALCLRSSLID